MASPRVEARSSYIWVGKWSGDDKRWSGDVGPNEPCLLELFFLLEPGGCLSSPTTLEGASVVGMAAGTPAIAPGVSGCSVATGADCVEQSSSITGWAS
jgi:hypothetical protein